MSDTRCVIPGCIDPSDPEGRPRTTPQHGSLLCGSHYGRLAHTLSDMPRVYRWLHTCLATTRSHDDRITGTRNPPVPLRVDIIDNLDQITAVLASWCRLVVEEHVPVLRGPRSSYVAATAGWLHATLPWIESRPWVDELYREVIDLRRRAAQIAPWQRHAHHLPTPCPACGERTLVLYGGDSAITCTECHELIPEDRYGLWERYVVWLHDPSVSTA